MGIPFAPVYGKDAGSAIESVEKIIAKIKTNKFDNKDLLDLVKANNELISAVLSDAYEN